MFIAALYRRGSREASGETEALFLTTPAELTVKEITDVWPLILAPHAALAWLLQSHSQEEAHVTLHSNPQPAWKFSWYPVSKKVTSRFCHGPELIRPFFTEN